MLGRITILFVIDASLSKENRDNNEFVITEITHRYFDFVGKKSLSHTKKRKKAKKMWTFLV